MDGNSFRIAARSFNSLKKKTAEQCLSGLYDEFYKQTGVDINSVGKSIAAHVDYGASICC